MIYLALIYIVFQVVWEQWGMDTVNSKVIYFAFQYGWMAALFVYQGFKGKHYIFYYVMAMIMFIISLAEFRSWNTNETTYSMMVSPPVISMFSILIIVLLILLIMSKQKQWIGLSKILGRR